MFLGVCTARQGLLYPSAGDSMLDQNVEDIAIQLFHIEVSSYEEASLETRDSIRREYLPMQCLFYPRLPARLPDFRSTRL